MFFVVMVVLYGVLILMFVIGGVEWVGIIVLVFIGGMVLIVVIFFWFVVCWLDFWFEDYEGVEISDGVGEFGFFSLYSWWLIMVVLFGLVVVVGIVLWFLWLIVVGVVFIFVLVVGLVFEYYVGFEKY